MRDLIVTMPRRLGEAAAFAVCLGSHACSSSSDFGADAAADARLGPSSDGGEGLDGSQLHSREGGAPGRGDPAHAEAGCAETPENQAPERLACAGLYADVVEKEIASGVRAYEPAFGNWSDDAQADRWIYVPEDAEIDTSDPDEWVFPVGTKLFKELSWKGQRAETRLFWKVRERFWVKTSYRWSEDEEQATRFPGGEVDVAGDAYYIPSAKECDQCHGGRSDRVLGFEAVLLGLEGASGLTVAKLVDEGMLSDEMPASYTIGDDGTGEAAPALSWLHVNCGVSCHNDNTRSEAYSTGMYMRLRAAEADGSPTTNADAITTTVGVGADTLRWAHRKRIVAGFPEDSLLYELLSTRDRDNPEDQMPPVATRVVDPEGQRHVGDWIRALGRRSDADAGAP